METRGDGFAGLAPFRYEDALGIAGVDPFAHFVPQADGGRVVPVVIFHQAHRHVAAESIHALVHPESHDVPDLLPYGPRSGIVISLLPGFVGIGMGVTVVESGLDFKIVLQEIAVAGCIALHELLGREARFRIAPDVVIAVLQIRVGAA